jgi:uroporphyrinogen decarboxylase
LGHEGGYVLAPGHNIQADTPVENIIAMYEAGRRINNTHQKIGRG